MFKYCQMSTFIEKEFVHNLAACDITTNTLNVRMKDKPQEKVVEVRKRGLHYNAGKDRAAKAVLYVRQRLRLSTIERTHNRKFRKSHEYRLQDVNSNHIYITNVKKFKLFRIFSYNTCNA